LVIEFDAGNDGKKGVVGVDYVRSIRFPSHADFDDGEVQFRSRSAEAFERRSCEELEARRFDLLGLIYRLYRSLSFCESTLGDGVASDFEAIPFIDKMRRVEPPYSQ
jgi:hypothetical protein